MEYVLDTATWINDQLEPAVLPSRIRSLLDTDEVKGLCSISLLETAIHFRLGHLDIQGALSDFFEAGLAKDIELLEITPAIADATNQLPDDFTGDPFDRTIVASARILGLTLVTPDREIRDARFCRVEFYPFRPFRSKHR
jgi:PIN domain nuclease of toxin-antitoxin system